MAIYIRFDLTNEEQSTVRYRVSDAERELLELTIEKASFRVLDVAPCNGAEPDLADWYGPKVVKRLKQLVALGAWPRSGEYTA